MRRLIRQSPISSTLGDMIIVESPAVAVHPFIGGMDVSMNADRYVV
jgi:hypothetical protein